MANWLAFDTAALAQEGLKIIEARSFAAFAAGGAFPVDEYGVQGSLGAAAPRRGRWARVTRFADGRFGFPHPDGAPYWSEDLRAVIFRDGVPAHDVVTDPARAIEAVA